MTYFRYYCKMSFTDVLKHHVAKYHTFQADHDILKYNVNPVVLETLVKDEKTLPPRATSANRTGRPKLNVCVFAMLHQPRIENLFNVVFVTKLDTTREHVCCACAIRISLI